MSEYFLGIDIGSSFTKYVVIDSNKKIVYLNTVKSLTRDKSEELDIKNHIFQNYNINKTCVTGYGRLHYKNPDLIKTELYCASVAISELYKYDKTIIDIGGEDIKIIKSSETGKVIDFYMNTRCAAGTGAFINEIAEKAEINLSEMSLLASKSKFKKELNSFCTVFAKTEIMQWIFEEIPIEDISKGIYISIVNRILKIPMDKTVPIILMGGVAEFHKYIKDVMEESFGVKILVPENPQHINAYGAALFAANS